MSPEVQEALKSCPPNAILSAGPCPGVQVCLHICQDLVACVPFFEDAEPGFVTSLVTQLRPTVSCQLVCICTVVSNGFTCKLEARGMPPAA